MLPFSCSLANRSAARRFNQDKSQGEHFAFLIMFILSETGAEEYNTELERMNAQMTAENLALQNDNKQLNALIKEYEQTLESLMTTFRNRAVRFGILR